MKIKLNNNISEQIRILNEAQPAPMDAKSSTDNAADKIRFNTAYEQQCKQQFMYSRRRDSLMIDIKMPSDIGGPLRVKKAPEDLGNLMRELNVNGKFLNIHNMVEDPQKTFNHASDYASNSFANLGTVQTVSSETEKNTANVLQGESYYYKGIYGPLNEDRDTAGIAIGTGAIIGGTAAAGSTATGLAGRLMSWNLFNQTGSHVGWQAGKLAGNLVNGGLQACIHFVGAGGIQLAASMGALYATGYALGTAFGHADPLSGVNNNREEQKSNIETKDNTNDENGKARTDTDMAWQGDNAIEALNEYINNVTESVGNLIAQISPKPDKYNEFSKEINKYLNAEDQMLATFFKNHNEIEKDAQAQIEKELENRKRLKDMHNEEKADFANSLSKLLKTADYNDVKKYYEKIQDHYMRHCTSSQGDNHAEIRNAYEEAVEKGKFQDVIEVYNRYRKNDSYTGDSVQYSYSNALNEAEEGGNKKPVADVTGVYNAVRQKVKEFMIDIFPIGDGKNIPGMQDLDTQMEARIKGASDAITASIDQVCSVFNKGQDAKLGDKLKQFFLSHPLQSSRLKELWTAHETELKMRKNRRLKQMQDIGNVERTLGWSVDFCKTVLPDLYARLFAYRYLLTMLKHNGYYNYTPELYKADEEIWEVKKTDYIEKASTETEWILAKFGSDYTYDNKTYLAYNDNGVTIENPMSYASLLMIKKSNPDFTSMSDTDFEDFIKTAHKMAGNVSADRVQDTIDYISQQFGMTAYQGDIFDKCEEFKISEEYRNIKIDIYNAYKQLSEFKVKMDNNNMTQCWNLLAVKPEIFTAYKKNYEAIKNIMDANKEKIEKLTGKNSLGRGNDKLDDELAAEAKNLEKQIHDILGDFTYDPSAVTEPLDFTKMLTPVENDRLDYYAYILSFYRPLLKASKISDVAMNNDAESIKNICNDTYKALELINSGILAIGHVMTENDSELNILQQGLRMYTETEPENKEKTPTLKDIYVYAGGDGDKFDAAYNIIDESLKENPQREKRKDNERPYGQSLKNEKEPDNAPDLIYNRVIAQLENPQDAINRTDKVKNNMSKLFTTPGILSSFDNLKVPENVTQAKGVTSLKGFAKIEDRCTFAIDDQTGQRTFLDNLKSGIRYIIEYVLASTYSEDATDSVEFNTIVKGLHQFIGKVNKSEYKDIYVGIKNAYVNSGGDSGFIDSAYQKLDPNDVSVLENLGAKLCNLLKNNDEAFKFKSSITLPRAIINSEDYIKNIKDCKMTTLYEIAANTEFDNNKEFRYILNETNPRSTFIEDFKENVKYIIDVCLQMVMDGDQSKMFNIIVRDLNNAVKNSKDITTLYPAMKDAFMNAGGSGEELDKEYGIINFEKEGVSEKFCEDFIKTLQSTGIVYNYDFKTNTPIVSKPGAKLDDLNFSENIKDCTAQNIYSIASDEKLNDGKFKYELNEDDPTKAKTFMDNFKDIVKYVIAAFIHIKTITDSDNTKVFNTIISGLHKVIVNIPKKENDNINSDVLYPAIKDVFVNADGDGYILDEAQKQFKDGDIVKFSKTLIQLLQNPASLDQKLSTDIDNLNFKENIKDCTISTIYGLADNDKFKDEKQNFKYELNEDNPTITLSFVNKFKSIVRQIITRSMHGLNDSNVDINMLKEKIIFGKTIIDYAKYVFDAINDIMVQQVLPLLNSSDPAESQAAQEMINEVQDALVNMNTVYMDIYKNSFTGTPLPGYNELVHDSKYDIQIESYKPENTFDGLFNILDIFKKIKIDEVSKISDIYNDLNGIEFNGVLFKDLSDNEKRDVIIHIVNAFKQVQAYKSGSTPNPFKAFNENIISVGTV